VQIQWSCDEQPYFETLSCSSVPTDQRGYYECGEEKYWTSPNQCGVQRERWTLCLMHYQDRCIGGFREAYDNKAGEMCNLPARIRANLQKGAAKLNATLAAQLTVVGSIIKSLNRLQGSGMPKNSFDYIKAVQTVPQFNW